MPTPQPIPAENLDDSDDVKGPRFLDLREFVLVALCLVDGVLPALESVRLPTARANGVVEQGINPPGWTPEGGVFLSERRVRQGGAKGSE